MNDETRVSESTAPVQETAAPLQENTADVQVTNNAPEAAQTQEVTQSEVTAEETAEEKLYAGKYKSVEELEKAYKNASSEASRISQEKAELTKILNDAFAEPAQSQSPQRQQEESFYDDYEESNNSPQPKGDDSVNRKLAIMEFSISHPDADGAAIMNVLKTDPFVNNITSYEAKLEYAHLRSQNMSKSKALEEARKQAAAEAQAKIIEKQTAQVESANKAEQIDERAELYSKATKGSPAERDNARIEYLKKFVI